MRVPSSFVRFTGAVGLVHLLLATVPHYADAEGGTWPPIGQLAGGPPRNIAVQGDYAYLAVDSAMTVIDISSPSQPQQVGYCDTPYDDHTGVVVAGDYAYVVDYYAGLRVISVADPTNPVEVGHCDMRAARQVVVVGDYAYLIADGLRVISVADPVNPVEVGYYNTDGYAKDLAVVGDHAYVALAHYAGDAMLVISVADPANPVEVGRWDADREPGVHHEPYAVAAAGDYAYFIFFTYSSRYVLAVISVADPANPVEVSRIEADYTVQVTLAGDYAYLVQPKAGLGIISVADPANPVAVGHYETPGSSHSGTSGVAVAGDYAYVADWIHGLRVISVADPANPVEVGWYETPCWAGSAAAAGDYAYLMSDGLRVISVANPTDPMEVGYCKTPGGDMVLVGDYAYVAAGSSGLRVISVADPARPSEVSRYYTGGYGPYAVAVAGDYAYVTGGGLRVISVADPANPFEVGRCTLATSGSEVAVAGDYAYLAGEGAGVVVVWVADPANPLGVIPYDTPGSVRDVVWADDYLYVADGDAGLRVISVADPPNPVDVGWCDTPGTACEVALAGDYAYVADGDAGLRVISVADPADPVEVAYWDTPGGACSVAVGEDTVCLADHGWGFLVFPLLGFSDVQIDDWAVWEIGACVAAGIVEGYDGGLYCPQTSVTRGQMAVYVSRALAGGDENVPGFAGSPSFGDVTRWHWASDYVEYALSQNVVTGYEDGLYHPEYEVTRDQMAVYVARALVAPSGEAGLADYIPADPRNFPDVPSDFWSYTHIEYCVENGVVQGYEDGYYHPEIVVTRDQMAVYVARAFGLGS